VVCSVGNSRVRSLIFLVEDMLRFAQKTCMQVSVTFDANSMRLFVRVLLVPGLAARVRQESALPGIHTEVLLGPCLY